MKDEFLDRVLATPHIEQYTGAWAIHRRAFVDLVSSVTPSEVIAHIERVNAQAGSSSRRAVDLDVDGDGIATINLVGEMTKFGSSFSQLTEGTQGLRQQVRAARRNADVRGVFLLVDSPGGTVAGTADLAADVAELAAEKPVVAYIEDIGASAAFWVASQATLILANSTAFVGGIGTYTVVEDLSAFFTEVGITVHVIASHPLKGDAEGAPVSDDQLEDVQRVVDELQETFTAGVAQGLGMSVKEVEVLADGRVHIGNNARALGLIDRVATLEEAKNELRARLDGTDVQAKTRRRSLATEKKMTTTPSDKKDAVDAQADSVQTANKPTETVAVAIAATFQELKAALPAADSDFICDQLTANATMEQARDAFMAQQSEALKIANASLAKAESAEKTPLQRALPGAESVGNADEETESSDGAAEQLEVITAGYQKAGLDRQKAWHRACVRNPTLRERMVAEHNAAARRGELAKV